MQCWKKGPGLDLEGVASHLGDTPGNGESVERFERKGFQDKYIKRALQERGTGRWGCFRIDILCVQTAYTNDRKGEDSLPNRLISG